MRTPKEIILKIIDLFFLFTIAFLFVRFIVTPTRTPTESMAPTIMPKDYVMINRVPYYFNDPKPGDVMVFRYKTTRYMKRIIGVPGDVLDIKAGKVYINGKEIDEPYLAEENSTAHDTMPEGSLPLTMPEDRYFVMGDNRYDSEDSRDFGLIHRKAIYGKAWFHLWPLNRLGLVK